MTYRPAVLPRRLAFGYFKSDGLVEPTPAVARALDLVVHALQRAGHEVIEWKPHRHSELCKIASNSFTADGARRLKQLIGPEEKFYPDVAAIVSKAQNKAASDVWDAVALKAEIESEYFDQWKATSLRTSTGLPIDGIICPTAPVSSRPHHEFYWMGYTMAFNTLGLPALTFPVLESDKTIDGKPNHEPRNGLDKKVWDAYDPDRYDRGCVGLQIVVRKFEDERAIALTRVIMEVIAGGAAHTKPKL
jgi:amidase